MTLLDHAWGHVLVLHLFGNVAFQLDVQGIALAILGRPSLGSSGPPWTAAVQARAGGPARLPPICRNAGRPGRAGAASSWTRPTAAERSCHLGRCGCTSIAPNPLVINPLALYRRLLRRDGRRQRRCRCRRRGRGNSSALRRLLLRLLEAGQADPFAGLFLPSRNPFRASAALPVGVVMFPAGFAVPVRIDVGIHFSTNPDLLAGVALPRIPEAALRFGR
mmetsp:Transcript_62071/g.145669  ORF Transcript_62071/g.145669 Transcript_62071/m.145669 type:complete len:220 (-) Transcript_62071:2007-2666(-)